MRDILEEIHRTQLNSITSLEDFRAKGDGLGTDILPSRSRGLYWLWCRTDLNDFIKEELDLGAQVPISKLVKTRNGLDHICKVSSNKFKVVYNGMGGYKSWSKKSSYGLRGRINQEVKCNNNKTGTLNIEGRGLHIKDWKISFFDFDDPENHHILKMLLKNPQKLNENLIADLYSAYANDLEILWRMHYGTPILCRY